MLLPLLRRTAPHTSRILPLPIYPPAPPLPPTGSHRPPSLPPMARQARWVGCCSPLLRTAWAAPLRSSCSPRPQAPCPTSSWTRWWSSGRAARSRWACWLPSLSLYIKVPTRKEGGGGAGVLSCFPVHSNQNTAPGCRSGSGVCPRPVVVQLLAMPSLQDGLVLVSHLAPAAGVLPTCRHVLCGQGTSAFVQLLGHAPRPWVSHDPIHPITMAMAMVMAGMSPVSLLPPLSPVCCWLQADSGSLQSLCWASYAVGQVRYMRYVCTVWVVRDGQVTWPTRCGYCLAAASTSAPERACCFGRLHAAPLVPVLPACENHTRPPGHLIHLRLHLHPQPSAWPCCAALGRACRGRMRRLCQHRGHVLAGVPPGRRCALPTSAARWCSRTAQGAVQPAPVNYRGVSCYHHHQLQMLAIRCD